MKLTEPLTPDDLYGAYLHGLLDHLEQTNRATDVALAGIRAAMQRAESVRSRSVDLDGIDADLADIRRSLQMEE